MTYACFVWGRSGSLLVDPLRLSNIHAKHLHRHEEHSFFFFFYKNGSNVKFTHISMFSLSSNKFITDWRWLSGVQTYHFHKLTNVYYPTQCSVPQGRSYFALTDKARPKRIKRKGSTSPTLIDMKRTFQIPDGRLKPTTFAEDYNPKPAHPKEYPKGQHTATQKLDMVSHLYPLATGRSWRHLF